ncbi:type II toxin-antitoxin system HicA family toxin [Fundidesulfovibrio putealis]|uniref:type II toxin-antitoxin system HicA family toxin n=1 Tax=Fundidesulfovibrio putealis TaxID=270496 RepID=UPI0009FECDAF|nr:type II toxin-antitoxin system HicA family toxin [Fundidesulfovibrio putealis]
MNSRNRKTLQALLTKPERGDIRWSDVEALLLAVGCRKLEGDGSRVRFVSEGKLVLRLHRPHPGPEVDKGAVKSIRRYLQEMGINQ